MTARRKKTAALNPDFIAKTTKPGSLVPPMPGELASAKHDGSELLNLESMYGEVRSIADRTDQTWGTLKARLRARFSHKSQRAIIEHWIKDWEAWRRAILKRTELGDAIIKHQQFFKAEEIEKAKQAAELAKYRAEEAEQEKREAEARHAIPARPYWLWASFLLFACFA